MAQWLRVPPRKGKESILNIRLIFYSKFALSGKHQFGEAFDAKLISFVEVDGS